MTGRDEFSGEWLTRCSADPPVEDGRLYGHVDVDVGCGPVIAPGVTYLAGTFDYRRLVLCRAQVRHCAEFPELTTAALHATRDLARRWGIPDVVVPPATMKRRRRRVPPGGRVRFWAWEARDAVNVSFAGRASFKHGEWARLDDPGPAFRPGKPEGRAGRIAEGR
ncbi:hypothetical protein [Actinoalloteichus spitiensis]|uniref:hypothetical protein n=1 Tax=Actinoalloteichus spitiensis TaxID=252394 RepID=UPI000372DE66|nr:hypothetical protein [Actinoalloteichus spitiensis]